MGARVALACAAAIVLLAAAPGATAQQRQFTLTSGNGGATGVSDVRTSADGSAVFFTTVDDLPGTGDRDGRLDLYRWRAGQLTLLTGPTPAGGDAYDFLIWRTSADGRVVLFLTPEDVPGTGDTDGLPDVYRVDPDGTTRLLTGSRPASAGGHGVWLVDASPDLSRVYVSTDEDLAGDDDGLRDGFMIADGGVTLLTGRRSAPDGGTHATLHAVSDDGSVAFFSTDEDIRGTGDSDGLNDIYRVERAEVRLVTGNRPWTEGGGYPMFLHASPRGDGLLWSTTEDVPGTADDDRLIDIYRTTGWSGGRDHELLSGSNPRASGGREVTSVQAVSTDAMRVVFSTAESIPDTGDGDGMPDLYRGGDNCPRHCERFDPFPGSPTLLTSGEPQATGGRAVVYADASPDLADVLFLTDEDVARTGDDDDLTDGYRATGARVSLLTGSRPATSGGTPVGELRISRNGRFVYFGTSEDVPGAGDTDGSYDYYRSGLDGLVLLTGGRPSTVWGVSVQPPLLPSDDERFVFVTAEGLAGDADQDGAPDVYLSTPASQPPATPPATAGPPAPPVDGTAGATTPGASATAGSTSGAAGLPESDTVAPAFVRRPAVRRRRLRFLLSEPAAVTITVARQRPGRRVRGRCRRPTRRTARAPRCVRHPVVARLQHAGGAGPNRVALDARAVGRRLPPGRYRATAVARDAAGNASRPSRVRFRLRAAAG